MYTPPGPNLIIVEEDGTVTSVSIGNPEEYANLWVGSFPEDIVMIVEEGE